jgi:hypothetical protein
MSLIERRKFILAGGACLLAAPALVRGALAQETTEGMLDGGTARRNSSSFHSVEWRDHFPSLKNGAILADTVSRAVHFWSEDESIYKLFPSSVPMSEDLTRRGMTEVIRKVEGPSWAPTPAMRERDPSLPDFVGPGPDNPLGTHALYLSWQYYRVHGTQDTRKIGRRSSSGCIGLYNEHIAELYALARVGTQVKLI